MDFTEEEVKARLTLEQIARESVYVGKRKDYVDLAFDLINSTQCGNRQDLARFYYAKVKHYREIKKIMDSYALRNRA